MKKIAVIGAAFSVGGAQTGSRRGAIFYRQHLLKKQPSWLWKGIIWQNTNSLQTYPNGIASIRESCQKLAHQVKLRRSGYFPVVIGGDHSCAIGTWSGMTDGKRPIGLLWIDAHFDSHTPITSQSKRIHGMPLAVLLGQGDRQLMLQARAVVNPQYTVVFGVHSFEQGEPELMAQLGVRYYTTTEIEKRGLRVCLQEAWRRVAVCPHGFGVSLDLDALDPSFAPAVSVPEFNGLCLPILVKTLQHLPKRGLKAVEIVEFNPYRERDKRTVQAMTTLISSLIPTVKNK